MSEELMRWRKSLAAHRKAAKMTLQAVADATGYSKTHIWELERGRATNPSLMLAHDIARLFNTTIDKMIG